MPHELTTKQIEDIAFAVLRSHNDDRLWRALTYNSGPYDVTKATLALQDLASAFFHAGHAAAPAAPAQAEQLEAMVDKAWLRFEAEDQRLKSKKSERVRALVNAGSFPGMSEAFDAHMGAECWTDPAYQPDASTWAAAWKAAKLDSAAQPSAQGEAVAWIDPRDLAELQAPENREHAHNWTLPAKRMGRCTTPLYASAPAAPAQRQEKP